MEWSWTIFWIVVACIYFPSALFVYLVSEGIIDLDTDMPKEAKPEKHDEKHDKTPQ